MAGHKKAAAAVKYGTQSEVGGAPPTHRPPYLEKIQNATDLFQHHQSAVAKAKTQII